MAHNEFELVQSYGGVSAFIRRWERTSNRVCPITGRAVHIDDILDGKYYTSRIGGDSANGYEVYPTDEYLLSIGVPLA